MNTRPIIRLTTIVFGLALLFASLENSALETIQQQAEQPLSDSAEQTASRIGESISTVEWLGPLAPIALSPFFGITCLSGLSMFSEGMPWQGNAFIGENTVLQNPIVFWVFLGLTLATSLPRLTKISKPLAQALDQLETYSGIITLFALRIIAATAVSASEPQQVVYVAGIFSMTVDTLMIIAMVINIIVINTIKFFFEVMVWLTPFPFVDAILEVANKLCCAALMAIYAFSPLLATIINLIIFTLCAVAFRWVYRRVVYARRILTDPLISLLYSGYGKLPKRLMVFPKAPFGPFQAKSKLHLTRNEDGGWKLERMRWLFPPIVMEIPQDQAAPELISGLLVNRIHFRSLENSPLVFSRRHNQFLDELATEFKFKVPATDIEQARPQLEFE